MNTDGPSMRTHLIRGGLGALSHLATVLVIYLIEIEVIPYSPSGHGVTDAIFVVLMAECALTVILLAIGMTGAAITQDGWQISDLFIGWAAGWIIWPSIICVLSILVSHLPLAR